MFNDKLAKHFVKDQTKGEEQHTLAAMGGKRSNCSNNYAQTIEEIDYLVSINEVTLEPFENIYTNKKIHTNNPPMKPTINQSQDATSSRAKKRTKNTSIDEIGMRGEIWTELENIGVESTSLHRVYMHLVYHPEALEVFMGIPMDKRKEMLPYIMQGCPFN